MIQNDENKKIAWLASFPKSGNTWLRMFMYYYFSKDSSTKGKNFDINNAVRNQVIDSSANLYKNYVDSSLKPTDQKFMQQVAKARPQVQADLANTFNVAVTTIKTHTQYFKWFETPTFEPKFAAGAIYIVRNPLDVAASLASQLNQTLDEAIETLNNPNFALTGQGNVNQFIGSWRNHALSWYSNKQFPVLFVRYEDMLENPVYTFGNILRFLKSTPNKSKLLETIEATSFNKLKKIEDEKGFVEASQKNDHNFFRVGKAGNWKNTLTDNQIAAITNKNKDVMELFGY